MAQFAVFRNKGPSKSVYPYLLDVQSDWTERLATRVVIPLALRSKLPYAAITRLMPEVDVLGRRCVLVTQELAGVSRSILGKECGRLEHDRAHIIAALDLLFTGA